MTTYQYLIGRNLWVRSDPRWNAAIEMFALPLFSDRDRAFIMSAVDFERRAIDWEAIFAGAEAWPRAKQILLHIAHALFGDGECQLAVLGELDTAERAAALMVIAERYR